MSAEVDALFANMAEAPMFGRGNYMGEGCFKVTLTNVFTKKRFKGGNVFIAEFKIQESNNPKHLVGSTGSWCPKIELPNTFGDIKSLIFAALGIDPKAVKPEDTRSHTQAAMVARALCGSETAKAELAAAGLTPEQWSILGRQVRLETVQTKTKEGRDFTRYTWSPATP